MDIRKVNGDRYFVSAPESQIELELLLSKLDLVSSIGKSIRTHRAELDRLNLQLQGVEQEPIHAPEGYLFTLTGRWSRDGEAFQISRFMPGRDSYWEIAKEEIFEKGSVFLADSIAAVQTYDWDDVGSLYAYSPDDDPHQRIRYKLEPGKYRASLVPEVSLPEKVVNPLPELKLI
jgi:hypothetical protein